MNFHLLLGILQVSYVLVSLSRSFGGNMLSWARECITLIPPQALTDSERSRFLNIISDASSGSSLGSITDRFAEISEVCRRNKTVQDIVQGALRPHDLSFTIAPPPLWEQDVYTRPTESPWRFIFSQCWFMPPQLLWIFFSTSYRFELRHHTVQICSEDR